LLKLDDGLSPLEVKDFVLRTCSLAENHLRYINRSVQLLLALMDSTHTDLAMISVADIFQANRDGGFPKLQKFIGSLHKPLEIISDDEILLAYRSFVARFVDVQVAFLYGEWDSAGRNIKRNIRESLKRMSLFSLVKESGGEFLYPTGCDALKELREFPPEELEQCLYAFVGIPHTTPELLRRLHNVLSEQSEYRRAVLLNDIVQLFKRQFTSSLELVEEEVPIDFHSIRSKGDVEEILLKVKASVERKVKQTYVGTAKVDNVEAEAMTKALWDIIKEWQYSGTDTRSLYHYLNTYLPVTPEVFKNEYYNSMNYLKQFMKEQLSILLENDEL
jgi:hypothetical protein